MLRRVLESEVKVGSRDSLGDFLNKCAERGVPLARAVGVVLEGNTLLGIITSGDVLAILANEPSFDIPLLSLTNKDPVVFTDEEAPQQVLAKSKKHQFLPKLCNQTAEYLGLFTSYKRDAPFDLLPNVSAHDSSLVFIAEIGNNHNGSVERAKQLIDEMADAGADVVKFQHRSMADLYANEESSNLGAEYVIDLVRKYGMPIEDLSVCFRYAREAGLGVMCTPWDQVALKELEDDGQTLAYKIASADFTNLPLIGDVVATGKPVVLSTGMSESWEITETIEYLREIGSDYALLHCNSAYPPPFEDLNLNFIRTLGDLGGCQVGYSGHERGYFCVHAAIALGARIIEKHVTVDRALEGTDHKISLLPTEFKKMVDESREVLLSLGSGTTRKISQGERLNRVALSKSSFLKNAVMKGDQLALENVSFKSPGDGIQPNKISDFIGKTFSRDFPPGTMIQPSFFGPPLEMNVIRQFQRRWGVPVRHRDIKFFAEKFASPMLEVHFSYRDLGLDHEKYFAEPFGRDLIYHAPELFENDHVLDLVSVNKNTREKSWQFLEKTIDAAQKIHRLQGLSDEPSLVLNCGGFSESAFLPKEDRTIKTEMLIEALVRARGLGCRILPQTMPPFPWHFGGKRFHNLMTSAENITTICGHTQTQICLDISHSFMWCEYSGVDLYEFVSEIKEYVSHMHISDSSSITDEGLQIGAGNIDFVKLAEALDGCGETFIVEVWQGHENQGCGFDIALKNLEGTL